MVSSGHIFQLITNDGRQDRFLRPDMFRYQLDNIKCKKCGIPYVFGICSKCTKTVRIANKFRILSTRYQIKKIFMETKIPEDIIKYEILKYLSDADILEPFKPNLSKPSLEITESQSIFSRIKNFILQKLKFIF